MVSQPGCLAGAQEAAEHSETKALRRAEHGANRDPALRDKERAQGVHGPAGQFFRRGPRFVQVSSVLKAPRRRQDLEAGPGAWRPDPEAMRGERRAKRGQHGQAIAGRIGRPGRQACLSPMSRRSGEFARAAHSASALSRSRQVSHAALASSILPREATASRHSAISAPVLSDFNRLRRHFRVAPKSAAKEAHASPSERNCFTSLALTC